MLFDSWYAANRLLACCRRPRWHVVCAIKSNRQFNGQKRSPWPQALKHQRYQRVQRTAPAPRPRPYLVRPLYGKRHKRSVEVCVLISHRHPREPPPTYCLCTDLALAAQHILSLDHKRWPLEVDTFDVKPP